MNGILDLKADLFAFTSYMKIILCYLQVHSMSVCHKTTNVEPLCFSNTQNLFVFHVFLLTTWMDVTVNGNGKIIFFSQFAWTNQTSELLFHSHTHTTAINILYNHSSSSIIFKVITEQVAGRDRPGRTWQVWTEKSDLLMQSCLTV